MSKESTNRIIGVIVLIIVLVFAMGLIIGGGQDSLGRVDKRALMSGSTGDDIVKFDDIEYIRPDMSQFRQAVDAAEKLLLEDVSLKKIESWLDECYEAFYNYDTMYTLARIRSYRDITDSFYAQELSWCEDNYPRAQQMMEELLYAAAASEKAQKLEEEYFWEGFTQDYADDTDSVYREEIVALMRQEAALLSEYRALCASPTIDTADGEVDYYDYVADLYGDEYHAALLKYYDKYNGEFARIYIDLVAVRRELAAELGYDSYEQMQYDYYFERDYTPEQAAAYVADIKQYMVPLYETVMADNPYSQIDYEYVTDYQLIKVLSSAAEKVGGDIEEAFDFMHRYGYYDVRLSSTKAGMSFQSYLTNYDAPFLFLSPIGDVEDILSLSHEFGHYVDAYVNYNANETIDVSECFSQAMELLLLSYYDDALTAEQIDNLYRLKMLDILDLYVQQASFAEFERVVYTTEPELLNADFLNELSLQLAKDYGYYDGVSEKYYAMSWSDISHFFEMPFYIISYPVSNDIAMQVYELERQQEGAGLSKYLEILPREYEGLIDTVEAGGLKSPFEDGRIEHVVEDLSSRLLDMARAAA